MSSHRSLASHLDQRSGDLLLQLRSVLQYCKMLQRWAIQTRKGAWGPSLDRRVRSCALLLPRQCRKSLSLSFAARSYCAGRQQHRLCLIQRVRHSTCTTLRAQDSRLPTSTWLVASLAYMRRIRIVIGVPHRAYIYQHAIVPPHMLGGWMCPLPEKWPWTRMRLISSAHVRRKVAIMMVSIRAHRHNSRRPLERRSSRRPLRTSFGLLLGQGLSQFAL